MLGNQILGSWWIVCSWLEAAPLAGPFGVEQCSTVQGWVGFSGIKKRCWKQLFLPPCLQILLSWSWKEPGSRKPFLHWQPAASSSKQPAPKASPHSCCQGTTSTAPSTAAASRHLPISPSCFPDLYANPHTTAASKTQPSLAGTFPFG